MGKGAPRIFMQMSDVHVSRVTFHGLGGLAHGSALRLMQIMRLDIATKQEAAGGKIMDNGVVAHGCVRYSPSDVVVWLEFILMHQRFQL
jgi:hypothetical protein